MAEITASLSKIMPIEHIEKANITNIVRFENIRLPIVPNELHFVCEIRLGRRKKNKGKVERRE